MASKRKSRRAVVRHVVLSQRGAESVFRPPGVVHPPKERKQHDAVVRHERIGDGGRRVMASVIDNPTAIEQLAAAGLLGDETMRPRLIDAADWFRERAEILNLRALVTGALERHARGTPRISPRQASAAAEMKKLAKAIGAPSYNRLFDLLVWDLLPLLPHNQQETIASLQAAAAYLKL